MSVTPVWFSGAEHGATPTTNGGGLANTVSAANVPAPSTNFASSGTYSYRAVVTGSASTAWFRKTLWTTGDDDVCGTFTFRMETELSASAIFFFISVAAGDGAIIRWETSSNVLQARFSTGTTDDSVALSLQTWYRVAWRFKLDADPRTLDITIYDVSTGDVVDTLSASVSQAASNATYVQVGWSNSATGEIYYDDILCSSDGTEHPLPAVAIGVLKPSADGTHNAGTNVIEAQDGTDIGTATAYDKINSVPPSSTAYIKQAATGTGNYAEVAFEDPAFEFSEIYAGLAILAYTSAATTANRGGCIVSKDNFSTSTTIWGAPSATSDYSDGSTSNLFFKSALISGLSSSNINDLKARVGYSDDANPNPYWIDLVIEVAYLPGSGQLSATVTQVSETLLAQMLFRLKALDLSQALESSLSQAAERKKLLGLTAVAETSDSMAMTSASVLGVLGVTEVDSAITISTSSPIEVAVGQAFEADSSIEMLRIMRSNEYDVVTAQETSLSQQVEPLRSRTLVATTESDENFSILSISQKEVVGASETALSVTISIGRAWALQLAEELTETFEVFSRKVAHLALSNEQGFSLDVSSQAQTLIAQAVEQSDTFSVLSIKTLIANQSLESDQSQQFGLSIVKDVLLAVESSLTQPLSGRKNLLIGELVELNQGLQVLGARRALIDRPEEQSLSQAITAATLWALILAFEVDTLDPLHATKSKELIQALEVDSLFGLIPPVPVPALARDRFRTGVKSIYVIEKFPPDLAGKESNVIYRMPADRSERREDVL